MMLNEAAERAPPGELLDIMDVGFTCAFLTTPYARRLMGGTVYVDGGKKLSNNDIAFLERVMQDAEEVNRCVDKVPKLGCCNYHREAA